MPATTKRQIQSRDRHRGLQVGVLSYDACAAGIKQVETDLGPIDVLVNNAGITRDTHVPQDDARAVVGGDPHQSRPVFNMRRQVIEGMRARKFGRIINISSINGQKGQFGQTNYSAAKAGDIGFTKALALESAKSGVTVNALPGLHRYRDGAGGAEGGAGEKILPQFRSAASASRKRSPAAWCFSPPTMPVSSPDRR